MTARTYDSCRACGEYDWVNTHRCKPRWRAWIHDYDEVADPSGGKVVHALSAEGAAEKLVASRNDEGQYIDRETLVLVRPEIGVRDPRPLEDTWHEVRGELAVDWSTRTAKAPRIRFRDLRAAWVEERRKWAPGEAGPLDRRLHFARATWRRAVVRHLGWNPYETGQVDLAGIWDDDDDRRGPHGQDDDEGEDG
jgi:hypothetical protein